MVDAPVTSYVRKPMAKYYDTTMSRAKPTKKKASAPKAKKRKSKQKSKSPRY
jgi:hypothetical protein